MTRHFGRITVLSLLLIVATPLYLAAQEGPRAGAGAGGGGAAGGASERGGGGGGGGGSSSGGGSGGSSGGGSMSSGGGSSSGGGGFSAPSPTGWRERGAAGVDRGGRGGRDIDGEPARQGAPPYSRPRGDRPVTGEAVTREGQVPGRGNGTIIINGNGVYRPYDYYSGYRYNPYGYGAFGLGYFYYDPMGWSYPDGYWYGYPSYGYGGGGGYGGYEEGSLKLKIKPSNADVYLDGYYIGKVDDFDGVFQRMKIDYAPHRVEVRLEGYEPLTFEVRAQPGRTITYRGELKPR